MNGPEHFREAERLIQVIEDGNAGDTMLTVAELISMAQVHATLAEAAATARAAGPGGMPLTDWRAWHETAGVPLPDRPGLLVDDDEDDSADAAQQEGGEA